MSRKSLIVVGLGYVGLPLAVAFGAIRPTIGYDIDPSRIEGLKAGVDRNREVSREKLNAPFIRFTTDASVISSAEFIIVAVPSPIDDAHLPDLSHLEAACRLIGRHLLAGATIVFESTVYPGCTEEVCVPILEEHSKLTAGKDFFVGYSPERINPGDREHSLGGIVKVVAAQDEGMARKLAALYGQIVSAGTHVAPNIRTAEAAKLIENIQRDLNIALMNELSIIFQKLGLDTQEVLAAAKTKWNFLPFEPGLVGGHCIPVNPYYLAHKASAVGHQPEVILTGRRINDAMASFVAHETIRLLAAAGRDPRSCEALILGATFKENVSDLRNSQVKGLIDALIAFGVKIGLHDPLVEMSRLASLHGKTIESPFADTKTYDALLLAVPHDALRKRALSDFLKLLKRDGKTKAVLMDIKGVLERRRIEDEKDILYWRL